MVLEVGGWRLAGRFIHSPTRTQVAERWLNLFGWKPQHAISALALALLALVLALGQQAHMQPSRARPERIVPWFFFSTVLPRPPPLPPRSRPGAWRW